VIDGRTPTDTEPCIHRTRRTMLAKGKGCLGRSCVRRSHTIVHTQQTPMRISGRPSWSTGGDHPPSTAVMFDGDDGLPLPTTSRRHVTPVTHRADGGPLGDRPSPDALIPASDGSIW
jgi:hypothetical protein